MSDTRIPKAEITGVKGALVCSSRGLAFIVNNFAAVLGNDDVMRTRARCSSASARRHGGWVPIRRRARRSPLAVGDRVAFHAAVGALHVFDAATGDALTAPRPVPPLAA